MEQIDRKASIIFTDADMTIREPHPGRMPWPETKAWEREFRNQVLKRIVQQMNRLGWTCTMPTPSERDLEQYGEIAVISARNKRFCVKGDLKADLELCGASIKLEMFQNVNAPDRPDHDGRYQRDKEQHMPYLMRLEMERTRRKIRDYLCNVFSGYFFDSEWMRQHSHKVGPGHKTSMEQVTNRIMNSGHYRPELGRASFNGDAGISGDGFPIESGDKVYGIDWHGRIVYGIAMYDLNAQWTIVTGKYGATYNVYHKQVFVNCPANPRRKRNQDKRRKRLESELNTAVARMDYRRAETIRDILFPPGEQIFCLWHTEHKMYHRAGFCGYTAEQMDAGKFTRDELRNWANRDNVIVPLGKNPR